MIPIKVRRTLLHGSKPPSTTTWVPAYLVSIVSSTHDVGGIRCVIAYSDPDGYGGDEGLRLDTVAADGIRIARTRIPLLEDTSGPLPDAAKAKPGPTKSGLVPCVCGAGGRDDCTC